MGVDKEDGQQSSKINIYEGNGKTCMVMTISVSLKSIILDIPSWMLSVSNGYKIEL